MITPEQRRKLESEWSSDDRSIAATARIVKGIVLMLMILVLSWIGAGNDSLNDAQEASTVALSSRQAHQAHAFQPNRSLGQ